MGVRGHADFRSGKGSPAQAAMEVNTPCRRTRCGLSYPITEMENIE